MRNPTKYPWETIAVGKSFIASFRFHQQTVNANRRYAPKKFSSKKLDESSMRVTRIA